MYSISQLVIYFLAYAPLLAFIAGLLTEEALLLLAILAGGGLISIFDIVILGFLGIVFHDYLIYFLVTSKIAKDIKKKYNLFNSKSPIVVFIEKIGHKKYFIPLIMSKFIYGARIALIVYSSHKEKNSGKFMILNSIAILIWMAIMIPIGWLAGRGFVELFQVAKGIEKILATLLIFAVLVYFLHKLFKRIVLVVNK